MDPDAAHELGVALTQAVRATWATLDPVDLYGLALFTDPEGLFIRVTAFSRSGLEEVAARYAARSGDLDREREDLRWSPADSPLHCLGDEQFAGVDRLLADRFADVPASARMRACFDALSGLDGDGLFGWGKDREALTLLVLQGDQSDRSRLENAERLNPAAVVARLRGQLRITEAVGVVKGLGSAYQISALDFAGGTLLAAGSGGEFLIWRQDGDGWQSVEAPQGGARWAATLSPDGAGVYVSDGSTVQTAPIRKHLRRITTFVEAPNKVRQLAWSTGGETLLINTWNGLVAVDWTGRTRWEADRTRAVAWRPEGSRVVVATGVGFAELDAATGDQVQSRDLRLGPTAIAVAADGDIAVSTGGGYKGPPPQVHLLGASEVTADAAGEDEITALAFSPDDAWLAGASVGGEVLIWHRDGRLAHRWRGRHESMGCLAWIDARTLAAAGRDVDRGPAVVLFSVA